MSKPKPVIRFGSDVKVVGLEESTRAVAAAVHRKPWLPFTLMAQFFIDPATHEIVSEDVPGAEIANAEIDYHVRIDPTRIKSAHNNRIAALQDRRQAAQRIMETVSVAATGDGKRRKQSREDLPDTELLTECYQDLDEALDERLLAAVMTDDKGRTEWDYTDEEGNPISLTPKLLQNDTRLAEALQTALTKWLNPTKPSSAVDTMTKPGNGTMDGAPSLTNGVYPSQNGQTPTPLLSDSAMPSTALENNGMTPAQ